MGLGSSEGGGTNEGFGGSGSEANADGSNASSSGSSDTTSTGLGGYYGTNVDTGVFGYSTTDPGISSLDNDTIEAHAINAIMSDPDRSFGRDASGLYGVGTDEEARAANIETSLMNNPQIGTVEDVGKLMNAWTSGIWSPAEKTEYEDITNYWDRRRDYKAASDEEGARIKAAAKEVGIDTDFIDNPLGLSTTAKTVKGFADVVSDIVMGILDTSTLGMASTGLGAFGIGKSSLGNALTEGMAEKGEVDAARGGLDGGWGSTSGTAGTSTGSGSTGATSGPGGTPSGFYPTSATTTNAAIEDTDLAGTVTKPTDVLLDAYKDTLKGKVT